MKIQNEHTAVTASSAVWDEENDQIVAITIVSVIKQAIESIQASLCVNHRNWIGLKEIDGISNTISFTSARRKYRDTWVNTFASGAKAYVVNLEHPSTLDPRKISDNYFYVLATQDEDLLAKFSERLNMAIAWPIMPEWTTYLHEMGKEYDLVKPLSAAGKDYKAGLCVIGDDAAWENIVQAGLISGELTF